MHATFTAFLQGYNTEHLARSHPGNKLSHTKSEKVDRQKDIHYEL